jgi:hypothetical protein
MKQFNENNNSQTARLSPDTIAFMMSSGFTPSGNWYQWVKNRNQQTKPVDER